MAAKGLALLVVMALAAAACSSGDAASSTSAATSSTMSSTAPTTTASATTLGTTTTPTTTVPAPSESVTTVPPIPGSEDPVEVVSAELRDYASADPPLTVQIGVPRLQGLRNGSIQQAVNNSLLAIVTGAEESFIADVGRYVEDVEPTPEAPVSSLDMFYDVRFLTPELLSIRFESSTYFEGAANPGQAVQTRNIDLTNGDELHLEDLFTGAEWAFALDTLLRERVTEELYEGDPGGFDGWVDANELVIPQHFAISSSGLEFSFQEFEIGPGVLGAPTVTLPFDAMGVYIDPDGILGSLADIAGDG